MSFFIGNNAPQTGRLGRAVDAKAKEFHSEYTSTFKWHEFGGYGHLDAARQQPMSSNADFQFMRKKKHPDVAYKSHELFDSSLAPGFPLRSSDVLDSGKQGMDDRRRQAQRRAQSEGPGIRNPLFRDDGNDIGPTLGKVVTNQHLNARAKRERSAPLKNDKSSGSSINPDGESKESKTPNKLRPVQMKESFSMGQILAQPSMSEANGSDDSSRIMSISMSMASNEQEVTPRRREYSSEYRKSFRPFSQYEYVDGRFIPSHGFKSAAIAIVNSTKAASLHAEPWYQEVVELRKQAQDYKCRGWGTDSVSAQNGTPHYQKQIELYEQAARRESLSALSLAITTSSRPVFRDEKLVERVSPTKSQRLPRPLTAPPPRGSSKSSRSESARPVSEAGVRPPSSGPRGSRDRVDASRSNVTRQPPGRARSPTKRVSRPPSASTASSSVAPSPAPELEMNGAVKSIMKGQQTMRQRPIEKDIPRTSGGSQIGTVPETVATSSGYSCHTASSGPRRPYSRSSSKTGGGVCTGGSRDTSRPPSAFENNIDYFREPVVKSPPEPTRVKSPEGIIRSPDPINWTVPLDTAKTFSVTQSVRDGDSPRNSPMSDHSSLFDSVSGTAINLGRSSYHHTQRISSLAKEAILQPGLIKDSTMTRPSICANDPSKPLATEAHPNPSIPEATEENTSKDDVSNVMTTSVYLPASNGASKHFNGSNAGQPESVAKEIQGTTLKCLDDPSFEFDSAPKPTQKKPSYRVLEDPYENEKTSPGKASKSGGYKVLEDPMMASVYEPSSSNMPGSMPSSRPIASEVLEGARERFDKFWGGKAKEAAGEN